MLKLGLHIYQCLGMPRKSLLRDQSGQAKTWIGYSKNLSFMIVFLLKEVGHKCHHFFLEKLLNFCWIWLDLAKKPKKNPTVSPNSILPRNTLLVILYSKFTRLCCIELYNEGSQFCSMNKSAFKAFHWREKYFSLNCPLSQFSL